MFRSGLMLIRSTVITSSLLSLIFLFFFLGLSIERPGKFHVTSKNYAAQYCSLYTIRLQNTREYLTGQAKSKWGNNIICSSNYVLTKKKDDLADTLIYVIYSLLLE